MVEEFKDIIAGLEQRIHLYKSKLHDLQKKREKVEDEAKTIAKYLELAETLYRVEVEKAKPVQPSHPLATESRDQSDTILLEKTKYSGLSVPQAAYLLLKESVEALHAKNICQKLLEGGVHLRGKTPITSVAISLSRDKRFKRVAPNTFKIIEETAILPDKFPTKEN